ncbi:MAG: hypothetical protein LBI15_00085 [Dysgonamonadaceae bacterium]|jgi:hypothetical protein|nr:hypothetical protein [Dysgonamonadaceae bacterium]
MATAINKSRIMKRAWEIKRAGRVGLRKINSFKWALVEAWKEEKARIKKVITTCYYSVVNAIEKTVKPTSYQWGNIDLTNHYATNGYKGD